MRTVQGCNKGATGRRRGCDGDEAGMRRGCDWIRSSWGVRSSWSLGGFLGSEFLSLGCCWVCGCVSAACCFALRRRSAGLLVGGLALAVALVLAVAVLLLRLWLSIVYEGRGTHNLELP